MNTKNNKRKRESCEKITEAFFGFLKTKELSQIKVSDICRVAGINRSTFYAAYDDVYDLANKIKNNLEADVMMLFDNEKSLFNSTDVFLKLLRHIYNNREVFVYFFKLGYDDRGLKLYDLCDINGLFEERYLDYHIEFFKNGFNAILKLWLEKGCRESPEEICEVLLSEYKGRIQ